MSKRLTHRLQQLENEIHVMLMLGNKNGNHSHNVEEDCDNNDLTCRSRIFQSTRSISVPSRKKKSTKSLSPASTYRSQGYSGTPRRGRKPDSCPSSREPSPCSLVDRGIRKHIEEYKTYVETSQKMLDKEKNEANNHNNQLSVTEIISSKSKCSCSKSTDFQINPNKFSCGCISVVTTSCNPECTKNALKEETERRKKAESLVEELREEMQMLRLQTNEISQSKIMAIDMTKHLKDKYETLRESHKETNEKMHILEKQNEQLCKCLEEQMRFQQSSDVDKVKVDIEEKFDKIEVQALESAKKVANNNGKLTKMIKERDADVKKLTTSNDKLLKSNMEKDAHNKRLSEKYDKIKIDLQHNSEQLKKLSEENEKLVSTIKNYVHRLEEAQKENKKHQSEIRDYQAILQTSDQEMEKLKEELANRVKEKVQKEKEKLEQQYKTIKDRQQKSVEELHMVNNKFKQLQNAYHGRRESENELQHLMEEHQKLQSKYDKLQEQLKACEDQETKKCKCIEEELRSLAQLMNEKDAIYLKEKEELRGLVQELTDVVKRHKQRIIELQTLTNQQEVLLQSQNAALASKNEQVRLAENETEVVKMKSFQLEKQIELLKKSLEASSKLQNNKRSVSTLVQKNSSCGNIEAILNELRESRKATESIKEDVLVKEKIIEDQVETINQLKNAIYQKENELKIARDEAKQSSQEVRRSSDEINKMNTELNKERHEKRLLVNDLTNLKWRKQQLKKQIEELEGTLETFCNCSSAGDMEKQQRLITSLERQVVLQQREWELNKQLMTKQKEQAINAARFATQKLLETVEDFQNQVDIQKQVQRMLTGLLHEKEEQLRNISAKMVVEAKIPAKMIAPVYTQAPLSIQQPLVEVQETFEKTVLVPKLHTNYTPQPTVNRNVLEQIDETPEFEETDTEDLESDDDVEWLNNELQDKQKTEMILRSTVQNKITIAKNVCTDIMKEMSRVVPESDCRCRQYPCRCKK